MSERGPYGRIFVTDFGNLDNVPEGVVCYSVSGETPDWYERSAGRGYRTCTALAPDAVGSHSYDGKHGTTPLGNLNADAVVRLLQDHTGKDVCLLYAESPSDSAHIRTLTEWLAESGFETDEIPRQKPSA